MTAQVMRQTVDDQNPYKGPAWFVSLCGAHYNGIQERLGGKEGLVVFTDPRSMDTMALPLSEATIGNIWRKLAAKRAERVAAMNEVR